MVALIPIVLLLFADAAYGRGSIEDQPPVISLELAEMAALHQISYSHRGAPCHTKTEHESMGLDSTEAPDTCAPAAGAKTSYATKCNVLTDTAKSCREPRATAFDHHEKDLHVVKQTKLVLSSLPRKLPVPVEEPKEQIDCENRFVDGEEQCVYSLRGEYVLSYDAQDSSGNQAENVVFAMVIIGTCVCCVFSCSPLA